jgi:hypothetical protein
VYLCQSVRKHCCHERHWMAHGTGKAEASVVSCRPLVNFLRPYKSCHRDRPCESHAKGLARGNKLKVVPSGGLPDLAVRFFFFFLTGWLVGWVSGCVLSIVVRAAGPWAYAYVSLGVLNYNTTICQRLPRNPLCQPTTAALPLAHMRLHFPDRAARPSLTDAPNLPANESCLWPLRQKADIWSKPTRKYLNF